jgi:hypothetical protein
MRNGWIVPGVILMLIMLIFVFVPLPYPQSSTVSSDHALVLYCPQVLPSSSPSSSYCFPGQAPITFDWSGGNASTWVEVLPCHTFYCKDINNTFTGLPLASSTWDAVGNGASGSIDLTVDTNASIMILTNSASPVSMDVTWNAMPEFNVLWESFALFGMIITVIGILIPPKNASPPPKSKPDEDQHPYSVQLQETEYSYPQEPEKPAAPQSVWDELPPEESPTDLPPQQE